MEKGRGVLVSVIIPTYKRPTFLPRAIDSVLKTKWENLEIIVVDDNTDGDEYRQETEAVMAAYLEQYDFIKYEKHSVNRNGSAARNTGFRASTGEYIMFLDDDDEFFEEKIHAQVEYMETHDETWGACYTKYIDVNDKGISATGIECKEGNLLVDELARNLFVHAGSNLMVRRNVVEELNGFDESFVRNQDQEFLVRILKKYKLGFVDVLGLAVHIRPRKFSISYYEITNHYLANFKKDIDELPARDRVAVMKMIGLQQFRYALQKRETGKMRQLKNEYALSAREIVAYLVHLGIRLVRRKSYGYSMHKLY